MVNRPNRKATDDQIILYNSLGLSLRTIGKELQMHQTSVAERLKTLGIPVADTRRSFMEDVVRSLTHGQQKWLADQLGPNISIKDYVKNLILQSYTESRKS